MFENKKILILGFAKSGYEAAKVLIKRNNNVFINDNKDENKINKEEYEELLALGVNIILGSHPDDLLDNTFDYLIKNPGVPIDHKYVIKAHLLSIPVINEIEIAYELMKNKNIKYIAITGTNGKTTTTSLIYEILKKENLPVHLAGNIGFPLCSFVDKVKSDDIIVIEVSCQQLENMDKFNPNIGVITNITEAHLEFMKTLSHYIYVKSKLLLNQTTKDTAILNNNDKTIGVISKNFKSTIKYFSSKNNISKGCYIKDNFIYYNNDIIISIFDIKLKGIHNYENIMASILVAKELNISDENINDVLRSFNGVEHRLEYVAIKNGITFYNDTEATNIKCTETALSSFDKPIILILGGYERNQNFNELLPYIKNVKAIIAIGQCKNRIEIFGNNNNINTYPYETLKEGFKKSVEIAEINDIILLSPASASWDQYEKCEDRGNEFKKYVQEIK